MLWHGQLWENTKIAICLVDNDERITKNDTLGQWETMNGDKEQWETMNDDREQWKTMNDDREQWANNFIKKG